MKRPNEYRKIQSKLYQSTNIKKDEMELDVIKYDQYLIDNIFEAIKNSENQISYMNGEL